MPGARLCSWLTKARPAAWGQLPRLLGLLSALRLQRLQQLLRGSRLIGQPHLLHRLPLVLGTPFWVDRPTGRPRGSASFRLVKLLEAWVGWRALAASSGELVLGARGTNCGSAGVAWQGWHAGVVSGIVRLPFVPSGYTC